MIQQSVVAVGIRMISHCGRLPIGRFGASFKTKIEALFSVPLPMVDRVSYGRR